LYIKEKITLDIFVRKEMKGVSVNFSLQFLFFFAIQCGADCEHLIIPLKDFYWSLQTSCKEILQEPKLPIFMCFSKGDVFIEDALYVTFTVYKR